MDNRPVTTSLLDLDFYKITMLQAIWKYWRDIPVKFQFINRDKKFDLAACIDENRLRAELQHIRGLEFTDRHIAYLDTIFVDGKKIFARDFLEYLRTYRLCDFHLRRAGSTYDITVEASWQEATLWETMILRAVNVLCTDHLVKESGKTLQQVHDEGRLRLYKKLDLLKQHSTIRFTDFGTRRAFSPEWQHEALEILKNEIPDQLAGTSNVQEALDLNLRPIGTFAHELEMVLYGYYYDTDNPALSAHTEVFKIWWEEYGDSLSIALNETYGSDFFFRNWTSEQARDWKGYRLDSGDAIQEGEKVIQVLNDLGVDPKTKVLLPSDGLTPEAIIQFEEHFKGRAKTGYGWGTNLMNDLGIRPLPIVVKITEANHHPTPKLSNNISKATGDPDEIERCKSLVNYTSTYNQPVKY